MNSIDSIESFIRGNLPPHVRKAGKVYLLAYSKMPQYGQPCQSNYGGKSQWYVTGMDTIGWGSFTTRLKQNTSTEAVAICTVLHPNAQSTLHLPLVNLKNHPGIAAPTTDAKVNKFWEAMADAYGGKRFLVFNSGNGYHGFLETLLDPVGWQEWTETLAEHPDVVDVDWLENREAYGLTLRVTGPNPPRLVRWVNL